MISRVARYFTLRILKKRGLKLCEYCDGEVISVAEPACVYCEMDFAFGGYIQ